MSPPPRLTDVPLWRRFEERALGVLAHALTLLNEVDPTVDELELNRQLFANIAEANRLINLENNGAFEFLPSYDGHQAPYNLDLPPDEFEAKRPDFTWSIQDASASSGLEGCREFVVECKRIGNEEGGTNFNHRYVDLGVVRFVSPSHKYGLRGVSGAMIGYVQRSDHQSILVMINERASHHTLRELVSSSGMEGEVSELRHMLDRTFGESPFSLIHLWVDVRPLAGGGSKVPSAA